MSVENYKELEYIEPFKYQLLQSFPFIADDFDQLTAYGLYCKLADKINEVVANNNNLNDDMLLYIQQFNNLKTYVDNYFDNLDVQDEIDNKLNEMTESGELNSILSTYVDNYLDPIIDNQDDRIDEINAKVNRVASGAPLAASSTSGMTDTDKIYVNTTNGYWYYYNGETWQQGGIYQTTVNTDEVARLQNEIDVIVDGLNFEKLSSNLLDPTDYFMNNALFDVNGHVNSDTRGFRIYCLNIGIGKNVSVKINSPFFYKIEASGNSLSAANNIVGVDNTTYVDTASLTPKTQLSFVTTKQYVFLQFFPATPQPTMPTTTTQIMVTNTATPQNYVAYGTESKIDVVNEQYSSDYTIYNQAYIKNKALVGCQRKDGAYNNGDYTGVKMDGNITKVRAKINFQGGGYITLISTPNGSSYITDVTNKSIHINIGKTNYYIGYFDNQVLTNTQTGTFSGLNDTTDYIIGYDINNSTGEITVYLPDGTTYNVTNINYKNSNGEYVIFEHFIDTSVQDYNSVKMKELFAEDTTGRKYYDDFARQDGAIGVAPTGHVYRQFSNNNPQNWEIN